MDVIGGGGGGDIDDAEEASGEKKKQKTKEKTKEQRDDEIRGARDTDRWPPLRPHGVGDNNGAVWPGNEPKRSISSIVSEFLCVGV